MTPTATENDRTNCIISITITEVRLARMDTTERDPALRRLPTPCQERADVLRLVGTELHGHQATIRDGKDLHIPQNRDLNLLASKELMTSELLDDVLFPEQCKVLRSDTTTKRKTYGL